MKRVLNTVSHFSLWNPNESFVIGVSGGADSLCLLDVLFLLSQKYNFSLHIVHINYRLRGHDADADEACVRERAQYYRLPITVFHPRHTSHANLEEKLRDERYRLFEKVRLKVRAHHIAVAHQRDDQAETLLLRLLRGSGMRGLSAMRPKNNFVIRPLLEMTRADILRYLDERHIHHREDQSNADQKFLRNKIRHHLIPLLERDYQPRIKHILAETASLLAGDDTLLTALTHVPTRSKNGALEISLLDLQALPEAQLKRELRHLLVPYYPKKSPSLALVRECEKLIRSTKSKSQTIKLAGLKIERRGAIVRLLNL